MVGPRRRWPFGLVQLAGLRGAWLGRSRLNDSLGVPAGHKRSLWHYALLDGSSVTAITHPLSRQAFTFRTLLLFRSHLEAGYCRIHQKQGHTWPRWYLSHNSSYQILATHKIQSTMTSIILLAGAVALFAGMATAHVHPM
jgi:hypothetical protein